MNEIPFEQIRDTLTLQGDIPLECSFSVGGVIYLWGPMIPLQARRIRSNALFQACLTYLRSHSRSFGSLDEAIATAIRDKWPNWEQLL
jgi:hypothetical protein